MHDKLSGRKHAVKNIECVEDSEGFIHVLFESMGAALGRVIVWQQISLEHLKHWRLSNLEELSNKKKVSVFVGFCLGMEYLHSIRIIQRDLKPDNNFVDSHKHVLIGDFGLFKFDQLCTTNTKLSSGHQNFLTISTAVQQQFLRFLAFKLLFELSILTSKHFTIPAHQIEDGQFTHADPRRKV